MTAKSRAVRSHASRIKIDMTPMADLALLLVMFFMLTYLINMPSAMTLNMPEQNDDEESETRCGGPGRRLLTIVLDKNNRIFYYQPESGADTIEVRQTDFSANGIRRVLLNKSREIYESTGKGPVVLIKFRDEASYQNMVDIHDELHITGIRIFILVQLYPEDKQILAAQGL